MGVRSGLFFFFQAEDGIRDIGVTGVQTCALPICTTEAANHTTLLLPRSAGGEVIISEQEHQGTLLPWLAAARRARLTVQFVPIAAEPSAFLEGLQRLLTPRTAVVVLSQVTTETGVRLPVEQVRAVLGPDVVLVVDVAQSLGHIPVAVERLGADVVVGNCYKWLHGPKSTA